MGKNNKKGVSTRYEIFELLGCGHLVVPEDFFSRGPLFFPFYSSRKGAEEAIADGNYNRKFVILPITIQVTQHKSGIQHKCKSKH